MASKKWLGLGEKFHEGRTIHYVRNKVGVKPYFKT